MEYEGLNQAIKTKSTILSKCVFPIVCKGDEKRSIALEQMHVP